jgi:hypothetical protein
MKKTRSKKSRDTVPLMGPNGGSVAMDSGRASDTALYGTEWREGGFRLGWQFLLLEIAHERADKTVDQGLGVTKRCRLSWLTYSVLVYEPKCGGSGGVAGSQPVSTAVHRSPNKLCRSYSILNLCLGLNHPGPK